MVGAVEGAGVASFEAELLDPVEEGFAAAFAALSCCDDMVVVVDALSFRGWSVCELDERHVIFT